MDIFYDSVILLDNMSFSKTASLALIYASMALNCIFNCFACFFSGFCFSLL